MGKQYLNGVLYGTGEIIKFSPEIYSLEEREVGVWTDGKPLYEKTFHLSSRYVLNGNTVCVQWIQIPTNILPIGFEIIDFNSTTTSFTHQICSIGITISGWLFIRNNCGTAIGITDFVLRYIKTTDTPGSGHYTTQGTEAHHYSTTEQIIGTWIDGSTLYEKTWDFGSDLVLNSNTWTNTTIKVSDFGISKIIRAEVLDSIGTYMGYVGASCDNPYVRLLQTRSANIDCRIITIQYTKTS